MIDCVEWTNNKIIGKLVLFIGITIDKKLLWQYFLWLLKKFVAYSQKQKKGIEFNIILIKLIKNSSKIFLYESEVIILINKNLFKFENSVNTYFELNKWNKLYSNELTLRGKI